MSEDNPESNVDNPDLKTDDVDTSNEQQTQMDTDKEVTTTSVVLKANEYDNMSDKKSGITGEKSENVPNTTVESTGNKVDDGYQSGKSKTVEEKNVSKDEKKQDTKDNDEEEIKSRGDINILLLSETGVGKTTFINAIANYLTHRQFERAEQEKLRVLIPAKFSIEGKNRKRHDVFVGVNDKNEFLNAGDSATQDVKSYIFPIGKNHPNIRIIDTLGMGDTRGPEQDNKNCDYILNYISNLKELHAICCLFRSTNTRNTIYFQYCISEILSRLDKSASRNIVFVFTNTRGSNYGSGETYDILRKTLDDIKTKNQVDISLKENIFCFDNEAFRYLAAIRRGVKFDESVREKYKDSWNKSTKEFWNLIKYVKSIDAHLVQSTNAVNEARRMINHLAQPLADISELIHDNIELLQRHQGKLDIENMTLDQLKDEMFMPVVDLEVVALNQPTTACTSVKCSDIYKVGDKNKWHYKQRCHEPCNLTNVKADTVNNPALLRCWAIDRSSGVCRVCSCNYLVHMHVYYMTSTIEKRIENANVLKNIDDTEKFLAEVEKLMNDMAVRKEELEKEHDKIVTSCAKFTHFLQKNAITPFNDAYKEYIEYLITREQSLGALVSNKKTVQHLRNLLQKYEETKKLFDNALNTHDGSGEVVQVTSNEILGTVKELYNLKHTGKKIKELYECQEMSRKREHAYTEYIHYSTSRKTGNYQRNNTGKKNVKEKLNTNKSSGNQEGLFRSLLQDFFRMFGFGSSSVKKGTDPQISAKEIIDYFRNVQKIGGAGFQESNENLLNQPFGGNPYGVYSGSSNYFQTPFTFQQVPVHQQPLLNIPINMPVQQYQKLMDQYLSASSHNNTTYRSPDLNPNISNDSNQNLFSIFKNSPPTSHEFTNNQYGYNDPNSRFNNSTINNNMFKYPEHHIPGNKPYHYGTPSSRPTQYFSRSHRDDYEQFDRNRFDRYDDRFDHRHDRYNDGFDHYDPRYDHHERRPDRYDDRYDHYGERFSGYHDRSYRYEERPNRYESLKDDNDSPSRRQGAPLNREEVPSKPYDSHQNNGVQSHIKSNSRYDPHSQKNTSVRYDYSSGRFIAPEQRYTSYDRRDISHSRYREFSPNRHSQISRNRDREISPNRSREISPTRHHDVIPNRDRDVYPNRHGEVSPNRQREVSPNRRREVFPSHQREVSPKHREISHDQHKAFDDINRNRSLSEGRNNSFYETGAQSQDPSKQYLYSTRGSNKNDCERYNSAGQFDAKKIDGKCVSSNDHEVADSIEKYKIVDPNRSGSISNNQQESSARFYQSDNTRSPSNSDSRAHSDQGKLLSCVVGNNSEAVIHKDEMATNQKQRENKFGKNESLKKVVSKSVISDYSVNKIDDIATEDYPKNTILKGSKTINAKPKKGKRKSNKRRKNKDAHDLTWDTD